MSSSEVSREHLAGVLVTGGQGFLGWHLRARLRALDPELRVDVADRAMMDDPVALRSAVADAHTVVHLAGVNRAPDDAAVETGNTELADGLARALHNARVDTHVVYANSIHSGADSPYGRGKERAAQILADAVARVGGSFVDVRLPNAFGEHGRPYYNSFVATFCHEIVSGRWPAVNGDRALPLMHAQDAAQVLIDVMGRKESRVVHPSAEQRGISEVRDRLIAFHECYVQGQIPDLGDKFTIDLFNTYRSFLFADLFPLRVKVNSDPRGELWECVRVHGGKTQTFVSTTLPGMSRGDHFHLNKVERFFVLKGEAEIALRRVCGDEVVRFRVSGDDHALIDMPTLWVHNITNVGSDELVTFFWADQLLNPDAPDTYWEPVDVAGGNCT